MDAKVPLLLEVAAGFLDALDANEQMDACLRTIDARDGHVRLADGTRRPSIPQDLDVRPAATGEAGITSLMSFAAREAITSGITMVTNNLVPRVGGELRAFVNDLSRTIGVPAQVNLYLSEREAPGFGRHWDDHDVLVIQCAGRKHWSLFAPVALSPRFGVTPTGEFGASVFSAVLEPGLALFIPRGWGHQVAGIEGEMSLHYTVGMRYPTGCDVLEHMRSALSGDERTAPVTEEADVWPTEVGRATLEHALGGHRMRFTTAPANGVLEADAAAREAFAGRQFSAPLTGGAVFFDGPERRPGTIGFAAGGHHFEVDPGAKQVMVDLFAGRAVTLSGDDGAGTPGSDTVRQVVLGLARRGLIDMAAAVALPT